MLLVAVTPSQAEPSEADAAPSWLCADERSRWDVLIPSARPGFLASRRLLRRLLEDATGVSAARWECSAQAGRAPVARMRDAPAGAIAPAVSLSHRLDWVAAAVSDTGEPVGVDVEQQRPPRSPPDGRAALMLSPAELAPWRALPEDAREAALLRAWVAKEAWYKAVPAGVAPWDFARIVALPADEAAANVRVWHAGELFVGLSCADAAVLGAADCEGRPAGMLSSFFRVGPAD